MDSKNILTICYPNIQFVKNTDIAVVLPENGKSGVYKIIETNSGNILIEHSAESLFRSGHLVVLRPNSFGYGTHSLVFNCLTMDTSIIEGYATYKKAGNHKILQGLNRTVIYYKDELVYDGENPVITYPNNDRRYDLSIKTPDGGIIFCNDGTRLDLMEIIRTNYGKNIKRMFVYTDNIFSFIYYGYDGKRHIIDAFGRESRMAREMSEQRMIDTLSVYMKEITEV